MSQLKQSFLEAIEPKDNKELSIKQIIEDPSVKNELSKVGDLIKNRAISDLKGNLNGQEYQFVDLVLEGGVMLGIALLGYTYALEKNNIRFLSIAGTSAGAITSTLLACYSGVPENLEKTASEWVLEILLKKINKRDQDNNCGLADFVDLKSENEELGRKLINKFKEKKTKQQKKNEMNSFFEKIKKLIEQIFNKIPLDATLNVLGSWLIEIIGNINNNNDFRFLDQKDLLYKLIDKNYINPNKAFPSWIKEILKEQNAFTVEDFRKNRLEYLKQFDFKENKIDFNNDWFLEHFKIIATDLTTSSKVAFPKMARLYCKNWENSTDFSVGDYVAASMSVPFFFKHFEINDLPQDTKEDWENLTGYTGDIPSKAVFTDGGIASNFPIDSFHTKTGNPKCPTLGVKLGDDRSASFHFRQAWIKDAKDYKSHGINDTDNIAEFANAILDTARQMGDFEFIHKNPDYKQLVSWINVDENQAFNFAMSNDELIDLFLEGVKAARIFLSEKQDSNEYFFDWEKYKQFRKVT